MVFVCVANLTEGRIFLFEWVMGRPLLSPGIMVAYFEGFLDPCRFRVLTGIQADYEWQGGPEGR